MFKAPSNLSPDLEWMLSSTQAGEAIIRETAARDYSAAMYRLALTLLNNPKAAQEAVQETLEILPANRHRYSGQTGARNWLFSLVIEVCRRRQRASSLGLGSKIRQPAAGQRVIYTWPEASPRETEADRQVWWAVDQLGERAKLCLLLSVLHRLPAAEIARVVSLPEGSVRKSLRRARLRLYRRLRSRICQLQVNEKKRGIAARFGPVGLDHRRARRLALARVVGEGPAAQRPAAQGLAGQNFESQDLVFLDAHLKSCPACRAYGIEMAELEALLARSLPARSSPYIKTIPAPETFMTQTEERLIRRGKRKGILSYGLQLAFTGLILVLILAAGWATNRLFPISAAAPLVKTVQVTRLVHVQVSVTQAAAPTQPAPGPLSEASSQDQIRQRMLESSSLWQSVWVDAEFFSYGPPGYIGPPQVYRNQVWIEQPERTMALSGPIAADPEQIIFKLYDNIYEMDLKSGLTYYYRAGEEFFQRLTGPPPAFTNLNGYNPRPLIEGTFVQQMLFPQALAQDIRSLRVLASETVLGRQALVVDATVSEGMPKRLWVGPEFGIDEGGHRYLLWVDTLTGILLRQQRFDPNYPLRVVEEVVFNAAGFGADFPEQSYSSYFFSPERFIWENEWIPAQAVRQEALPAWQPPPDETPASDEAGPAGTETVLPMPSVDLEQLDFSRIRLTFRWEIQPGPGDGKELEGPYIPEKTARLFAGDQFLGRVELGNPWYLVCERSPDGQKIVFNEGWADPFLPIDKVRWFSLSTPHEAHFLLPEGSLIGSDVAFSPDSRSVAFWGCGGSDGNCGIYIYSLETLKTRKLIRSENAAHFTWSPDGESLAMIRLDYSRQNQHPVPRVTVLGVRYGNIVYQDEFDFETKVIPEESPTHAWGADFPPLRTGLGGCIQPPVR